MKDLSKENNLIFKTIRYQTQTHILEKKKFITFTLTYEQSLSMYKILKALFLKLCFQKRWEWYHEIESTNCYEINNFKNYH